MAVVLGTGINLRPRPRSEVRHLGVVVVSEVRSWYARFDGRAKKYQAGRSAILRQALWQAE